MDKQSAQFMIETLMPFSTDRQLAVLRRAENYQEGKLTPADGYSSDELIASHAILSHNGWLFFDGTLEEVREAIETERTGQCDACGKRNALKTQDTCAGEGDFCLWGCV